MKFFARGQMVGDKIDRIGTGLPCGKSLRALGARKQQLRRPDEKAFMSTICHVAFQRFITSGLAEPSTFARGIAPNQKTTAMFVPLQPNSTDVSHQQTPALPVPVLYKISIITLSDWAFPRRDDEATVSATVNNLPVARELLHHG